MGWTEDAACIADVGLVSEGDDNGGLGSVTQSVPGIRIGVDIGGTFTDTAACDAQGVLRVGKTLTTPGEEGSGVLSSIANSGAPLPEAKLLVHGTTLVINALLERRGAPTALVTTAGFGDVIELGRGSRPETYNPFYTRLSPFVPPASRFELPERMSAAGEPVVVPTDADIDRVVESLRRGAIEAVAVAFLHSYRNPAHETRVAARIAQALPDVFVTCSSDLGSQWREYERFTTATANAYVAPIIRNYTSRLIEDLAAGGFAGDTLFLAAVAARWSSRSSARKIEGWNRPQCTSASVMVGSTPPRP